MKKTLLKDTFREIKKSFGRFFAIFAIVAIGVAFFAGVKSGAPIMKYSADKYYDDYNLMDFRVLSTMGLTEDDVDEIRKIEGVKGVFPTYSIDVLTKVGQNEVVLKVHALPIDNLSKDNEDYINRPKVIEGRLPQKSGECVIEKGNLVSYNFKIGDKITLESGNDKDISESLNKNEYTIVGTVETPYYLSYEKGSSGIGSGSVNSFIMIPQEDFNIEVYTEVFLTVKNAKELNSYSDEYFDVTDKVKKKLEDLGEERAELRIDDLKTQAQEELDKGKKEYEDNKALYEEKIRDGENKITQGKEELKQGEQELQNKEKEYNSFIESTEKAISNGEEELKQGQKEYDEGVVKYNESKAQLENIESQYNSFKVEYNKVKDEFTTNKADAEEKIQNLEEQLVEPKEKVENLKAKINELYLKLEDETLSEVEKNIIKTQIKTYEGTLSIAEGTLNYIQGKIDEEKTKLQVSQKAFDIAEAQFINIENQFESGKAQLNSAEQELNNAKAQIEAGTAELQRQKANFESGKVTAQNEFKAAREKLATGQKEIEKAEEELNSSKKYGEEELNKALEKINKGQEKINSLEPPTWYVLDRNSHYSYVDYGSAADRINSIAKVFPVFFLIVAALVCLTTMTRMVDEQRGNIGTLKALGYEKTAIASKYILYALVASVLGSIVGVVFGMTLFPVVIYNAWAIMYTMPSVTLKYDIGLALTSALITTSITTLAALGACYKELVATPSALMRPLPPKNGKRIFLERIGFIWSRLSFTKKVTARNLFRYKKRFFMTVIGISGCTALLLVGYGIKDSIKAIPRIQFQEIVKASGSISFTSDSSIEERKNTIKEIKDMDKVQGVMEVGSYNGKVKVQGKDDVSVTMLVPSDTEEFKDYMNLRERVSKKEIELNNDGAVISEKFAKDLNLNVGDTFKLDNGEGYYEDIEVSGIMEMYAGHYVVLSPEYYKDVYKVSANYNSIDILINNTNEEVENKLGSEIMELDNIKSVSFYSSILENFDNTIASLNYVTIVLIVSAAALAFVVLYNLTNINISERLREIATIKVLGFYDNEVAAYVYRENMLLTFIGSLLGLGLGILLHRFIMTTIELENVMFGRNINGLSFLYSVGLTVLFGALVNLVMYFKLKKIPMVESLKSVE